MIGLVFQKNSLKGRSENEFKEEQPHLETLK